VHLRHESNAGQMLAKSIVQVLADASLLASADI
jgi:hypothetical protein